MSRAVSPRGPVSTLALRVLPALAVVVVPVSLTGCAAPATLVPDPPPPASHAPVVLVDADREAPGTPPVRDVTVPDVVGMNLRDAANTLDAVGLAQTEFTDAVQEREVAPLPRWRVCTQSPLAGDIAPATVGVVLESVPLGESCPDED